MLLQRKQVQKEEVLKQRMDEAEAVRRARAEESRLRAQYIQQRLAIKVNMHASHPPFVSRVWTLLSMLQNLPVGHKNAERPTGVASKRPIR